MRTDEAQPLSIRPIVVEFGDCDPAGIVYYPNFFRWTDSAFHHFMNGYVGGHTKLSQDLNVLGLGVIRAELSFRRPVRPGDFLEMSLDQIEWGEKSFTLHYTGRIEGKTVCHGQEVRGVFIVVEGDIRAAEVAALRTRFEAAISGKRSTA